MNVNWKPIIKVNTRYGFALGNKKEIYAQFTSTLVKLRGNIATVRDDDGALGHFYITEIKYAAESPVDKPTPASTDAGTEEEDTP